MAVMIQPPFIHVEDANGNPYVGAKLYVYQAGTTTLVSLYSDDDLLASLANPLTSDSAGNFARAFLAAGTYKLRAETSTGTLIWQYDDIDTCLAAGSGALAVSKGGTGATTAAGARTSLDVPSNADVTALSSQIATFQTTLQNIISQPQGRLTLTSATPVLATGVTAGTAVYYTPYVGNLVPIWNGTQYAINSFSELTLTLHSNHTANSIYDVFVFLDSSTVTIGTGPAWNTATAGSGARGTGAGTTELERKNGLWTNKVSMTARNGSSTYTVDANKGIYVGSIYMDGTNGQISAHTAYGQNRKWGVWNAYNRVPIIMKGGDSTSSWSYNSATVQASNGSADNKITSFTGLDESSVDVEFVQFVTLSVSSVAATIEIGIGVNSTTAYSGKNGRLTLSAASTVNSSGADLKATHDIAPALGIQNIQMLEAVPGTNGTETYSGTEPLMKMSVRYLG